MISDAAAGVRRSRRGRGRPASIDLGQQLDLAPARCEEMPVERLDAVLPDADVDGLGLGGDVGAQLGAAPLGKQLDAERRAGWGSREDRPDDDRDLAAAVAQRRAKPARRSVGCRAWRGPARPRRLRRRRRVSGLRRCSPRREASQATW